MIYYHKYASDKFMEWATLERDDIMKTEIGDIFSFEYDGYCYDGKEDIPNILWKVVKVYKDGKYLHIKCEEETDEDNDTESDEEENYSDTEDEEDHYKNNQEEEYPLNIQVKYKRRLDEYKVYINRDDKKFKHYVCRKDRYPFSKYNPYNGH